MYGTNVVHLPYSEPAKRNKQRLHTDVIKWHVFALFSILKTKLSSQTCIDGENSSIESQEYDHRDPSCSPPGTLYLH
jgi:hypothetical protein